MYPRTATPENPWTQEEIREFRIRAGLPPEEQLREIPPPPAVWPQVLALWLGFTLAGLLTGGPTAALGGFLIVPAWFVLGALLL